MLDVQEVNSHSIVTMTVKFSGAPVTKGSYTDYRFLPDVLVLRYVYRMLDGDVVWRCTSATASGQRVLKPAPDGSQRLGKERTKRDWDTYGASRDLTEPDSRKLDREPRPEWLCTLVDELRPSGELALPA